MYILEVNIFNINCLLLITIDNLKLAFKRSHQAYNSLLVDLLQDFGSEK